MIKKEQQYTEEIGRLFYPFVGEWAYDNIEITFQVTEACSLACTYCYQHDKSPKVMSFEVAKKLVDRIFKDYSEKFCVVLEFIGGEPLLQAGLIKRIIDYWYYKCIMENSRWGMLTRFSICSNGTEWDTPEVQELFDYAGKFISFTVSIDGNKELHDSARLHPDGRGSYDEAIHAATEYEKRYQVSLGSKMTIAPSNIIFLYPAIKHYITQGKTDIHANTVYEEGWTTDDARLFYRELKKIADYLLDNDLEEDVYVSLFEEQFFTPEPEDNQQVWCGGAGKMLACDPDGKLYPCLRYMPSSVGYEKKPITCGDVDHGVDRDLLNAMQTITRRSISTDKCYYCPIATGCSYCIAYNWETFGTINARTTFTCEMHQARALANVYFWNKLYRKHNRTDRKKNNVPEDWALNIVSKEELIMLNDLALEN